MIWRYHIFIPLFVLMQFSCKENLTSIEKQTVGDVELLFKHQKKPKVGEDLLVIVTSAVKKNIPMTLVMNSGLGVRTYDILTQVKLVIPDTHLTESGRYTFTVLYAGEVQAVEHISLDAGQIVNPLDLYTGPRSILVGGKQNTMVTTIPTDQYDNGITKKTTIQVSTDRSSSDSKKVSIKNLLAVYKLSSDNQSKIITAGVSKGEKSSKAQAISQEPDWAVNIPMVIRLQMGPW